MPATIGVKTRSRNQMVDITPQVQQELTEAGFADGICVVYVPHTTAGITINEGADPAVCADILRRLEALIPPGAGYRRSATPARSPAGPG